MFNETSYPPALGDLEYEKQVKAGAAACMSQWKAAGRPQTLNYCQTITGSGAGLSPKPGAGVTTMPAPSTQQPGGSATGGGFQAPAEKKAGSGFFDNIGEIFSNIPPTLLYVGGAVIVFMMLKKR